jgi:hypothetical protein
MTCPHCRHKITLDDLKARLSEDELKTLWASYTGKKQTPHAGPGRPRKQTGGAA